MTRLAVVAVIALIGPAASAAQTPPQTVRAAGMPLTDGALPPGSLTVRLVQGAFAGDLSGVTVEIEVDGRDTRRAQTGAMGRAEFAHLPIGARVRASAVVNGERLESEPFPMPAEGGVRMLLVTGTGGTGGGGAVAHGPLPAAGRQGSTAPPPLAGPDDGADAVRITVVSLTILAFVLVGVQQWRRRQT